MQRKTPLYETHLSNRGKMVDFAGYELPIQYPQGIITEHHAVRNEVGLFDVSHMARLWLTGPDATEFLNYLITNDVSTMKMSQMKYTLLCNPQGGIIDDILVYKFSDEKYLIVGNAANHQKVSEWIQSHLTGQVSFKDSTHETGLIALQGPKAESVLRPLMDVTQLPQKYYTFNENVMIDNRIYTVSRNGYTGEDGFEIMGSPDNIVHLASQLYEAGVAPCGLGARDTLRLEAGMPLYGQEMSEDINPYEVGLGFFVKLNKDDFIGKEALKNKPLSQSRVGLKMIDRGIARLGSEVYLDDQKIGVVTSGTQLPTVGYAGAMAFVKPQYLESTTVVTVDVRGRKLKAEIIKLPFYSRKKKEDK